MTQPVGYPVLLDLAGRRVLVVGGGAIAARRVAGLLTARAAVHVVAPSIDPALVELERAGAVTVERRGYRDGDLRGAWLVQACTDQPAVNAAVAAAADELQIPCVRADLASGGTARTPAVARSGDVVVAVNTAGDPRRAVRIRDEIFRLLEDIGGGVPPLRDGGPGWVALVGAGPGDPGLMTVRARRLLATADVVVIDRLAPDIGHLVSADTEVVDVGKAPGEHRALQEEINALLVERARRGQRVVRWKGGDPFVLGRGGEEMAACLDAGVQVHVVPGVSSALAGPLAAGIPLTHRGVAADFTVLSGHRDAGSDGDLDWLAAGAGASTLVLLMAMGRLAAICAALIETGRAPGLPVAVVQNATLPGQRVAVGTLADIAEVVAREGLGSPAIVIVGEVVRVRPPDWPS